MLADVQQVTIGPLIRAIITPGSMVYTDEDGIYHRLEEWGYEHRSVCHAAEELAWDDDGDGFCEVNINPMGGFWSLLRSGLRPHRGAYRRRSCRCPWAFSSSSTTSGGGARRGSEP